MSAWPHAPQPHHLYPSQHQQHQQQQQQYGQQQQNDRHLLDSSPASSSFETRRHARVQPTTTPTAARRTVQDLPDKQCWVCYTTQQEDAQAGMADREWVHACSCTLVAHSACLLAWYATDVANKQQQPACPVCRTPYQVSEQHSSYLTLYKKIIRKWDKLSTVVAATGLVAGTHLVLSAYGAFAVRAFAGQDVARALLFKHDKLPLRYWINLPLIPLTLILSRTPLLDSLLPFGPLALVLSSTPTSPSSLANYNLTNLTFTYPPSPTLTLCLLPWFRVAYLKLRHRVFDAILGKRTSLDGWAGLMETVRAADEGDFEAGVGPGRLEVVADLEIEERVVGPDGNHFEGQELPQNDQPQQDARRDQNPRPQVINRLRVGLSRLTALVIGALLYPSLCSIAGSALFFIASRQAHKAHPALPITFMRKLLGVQAIIAARAAGVAAGEAAPSLTASFSGYLKYLFAPKGSILVSTTPLTDPVWLRNAIGGGLVLLARDAFELGAGVLEHRRKSSRRIVGRPFADQLDLGQDRPPVDASDQRRHVSNAGVDSNGRQAVVTSLF
ncbi:hypothetical protein OIO90_004685 [Microbotryomycetes sp. JL221]|nr:hypothetical protein OIO90_004685 [Microbotryomycetes sp. JL221]